MKFQGKKEVLANLSIKPVPELGNLVPGALVSVEVIETQVEKIREDGSENTWEYAGFKIPALMFTFKQSKSNPNDRDRILNYVESIITFRTKDGMPVPMETIENLFTQMNDRIVHIHDAYKNDINYTTLSDFEFDEKGDTKSRIESFKNFFLNIADSFNKGKNQKPIYLGKDDKLLPLYIKVLPDYNTKSFYTLPSFVRKGFIERANGQKPNIELTASEKASFELRSRKGTKPDTASNISTSSTMITEELSPEIAAIMQGMQS